MSGARKAVDSTIRRILVYTAEIIASIILLIIICLPLAFVVPMWIQQVVFGTPTAQLLVNPIAWFGPVGAVFITLGLGGVSSVVGYLYVTRLLLTGDTVSSDSDAILSDEDE
ncbi:hypothetical protein EU537_09205 [Candidatus Thorarchaeota archaeon]|nr:MAG: hypothetical protein EU537_09205 [Candidatus Thorarchaeota archaeon]